MLHRVKGRFKEAELMLERAAAIQERSLGREHAEYAYTLEHQAVLAAEQQHYDRA